MLTLPVLKVSCTDELMSWEVCRSMILAPNNSDAAPSSLQEPCRSDNLNQPAPAFTHAVTATWQCEPCTKDASALCQDYGTARG